MEKASMFLARVQLPEDSNYDQLHQAMKEIDFLRFFNDNDNHSRELPQGTYLHPGIIGIKEAFESVESVAKNVNRNARVVLVEAATDRDFMFSDNLPTFNKRNHS
jgi:hypothetical protein